MVPRPLSFVESSRPALLLVDGGRSASPTPSFMSALSAGEYNRNRAQRSRSNAAGDASVDAPPSPIMLSHLEHQRRSMSPVLSNPFSNEPDCRISHWRSRTISSQPPPPPPPPAGPPPTGPLPPTPPAEPVELPPPTYSLRSRKRQSDAVARQRAEARAALEGRSLMVAT